MLGKLAHFLPASLTQKKAFQDLLAILGIGAAAFLLFWMVTLVGIRVVYWTVATLIFLGFIASVAALYIQAGDPRARANLRASFQNYLKWRRGGAAEGGADDAEKPGA